MANHDPVAQAEQAPQEGGAAKLLADANSSLMELSDLMASAGDPEDAQKLSAIIASLNDLAQDLSMAPGQKRQPQAIRPVGNVPAESGAANTIPAL